MSELADALEKLAGKHRELWYIEKTAHDYPNGTTHFTHVGYHAYDRDDAQVTVAVANHVTPELGELLCALHNNLTAIVEALRKVGQA